jgi:hypothetical protein
MTENKTESISMQTHINQMLGEELVAKGYLTAKKLAEALSEQKRTGRKLGQILLDNNYVTEEQIARVLASQQGLPYIDLKHYNINLDTVTKLDEMQSRKYRAVVLEDRKTTYLVAVSDPYNLSAQDALSARLHCPLEIAVVTNEQLNTLIEQVYSKDEQLTAFARAVESDVDSESNIINLNQISATVDDADAPVVRLLQTIFRDATQLRASDIHIEPQDKQLVVRYRFDGKAVDLMDIAQPLMVVGTARDHISPWKSVYKIHAKTNTNTTFILASGGHNAGIISEPGHPHRSYQIYSVPKNHDWIDSEQWLAQAAEVEGSWWPAWSRWLSHHSSSPVKAKEIANGETLQNAPGKYVQTRYND